MRKLLRRMREYVALYIGLALLGIGCLAWSVVAVPLNMLLPARRGMPIGRRAICLGFRMYLFALRVIGVARFDIKALDALRDAGPLIIAPNHPCLLDALMVLSRLPHTACVLKASLIDNLFMGAGSRLAGYIPNDQFIGLVRLSVEELQRGSQLLLFPEGTRSEAFPVSEFKGAAAVIAARARVPVQAVIIETDSGFLGKGWSLFKRPDMPVHYRIRLGRRFDPASDPHAFTRELQAYFAQELRATPRGNASGLPPGAAAVISSLVT